MTLDKPGRWIEPEAIHSISPGRLIHGPGENLRDDIERIHAARAFGHPHHARQGFGRPALTVQLIFRRRSFTIQTMLFRLAVLSTLLFAGFQERPAAQRIVVASNVRLRAAPQTSAEELARLSIGEVLTELEISSDGVWYRVLSPDRKTGWIFGNLTESFSARESLDVYRRTIQRRLGRDFLGFDEATDLFQFADRIVGQVPAAARAEFDLFRLRALDRSLDLIQSYEPKDSAHRTWIGRHGESLDYSEPAGRWLVKADLYWQLEAKHRGNPIADDIAWHGAKTGLPGECEGHIACYVDGLLRTDARYLSLYPEGRHASEALKSIGNLLEEADKTERTLFIETSEVVPLQKSMTALAQILERIPNPAKIEMLERLKRISQVYR